MRSVRMSTLAGLLCFVIVIKRSKGPTVAANNKVAVLSPVSVRLCQAAAARWCSGPQFVLAEMTTWVTSATKINVKSVQKVKDFTGSSVICPPEGNGETCSYRRSLSEARIKVVTAAADNESGPGIMRRKMKNENDRATMINNPWRHVSNSPDACQIGPDLKIFPRKTPSVVLSSFRSGFHQEQRPAKWLHSKALPADYFLSVSKWLPYEQHVSAAAVILLHGQKLKCTLQDRTARGNLCRRKCYLNLWRVPFSFLETVLANTHTARRWSCFHIYCGITICRDESASSRDHRMINRCRRLQCPDSALAKGKIETQHKKRIKNQNVINANIYFMHSQINTRHWFIAISFYTGPHVHGTTHRNYKWEAVRKQSDSQQRPSGHVITASGPMQWPQTRVWV